MLRTSTTTIIALLAAVTGVPAAAAESGEPAGVYASHVVKVQPPAPAGIAVRMLPRADRIQLDNAGGHTVIVFGYQGEPYLRFQRGIVSENAHSPAAYLNLDRYGEVQLPAAADAAAQPAWRKVADGSRFAWQDHRVQWMSRTPPADVQSSPTEPHVIFYWRIPVAIDGRRANVLGVLRYTPAPVVATTGESKSSFWSWHIPAAIGLVLAAALACWWLLRRPRQRA